MQHNRREVREVKADPSRRPEQPAASASHGAGHATTRGAAAVGGVTGGGLGTTAGPIGTAAGAVGGAIVGAAAQGAMHREPEH